MQNGLLQRDTLLWMAMILASAGMTYLKEDWRIGAGLMVLAAGFLGFRVLLKKAAYEKK